MSCANHAVEEVYGIPATALVEAGMFQGFTKDVMTYIPFFNHYGEFRPRTAELEKDASFKQLIPYTVLQHEKDGVTTLFAYRRDKGGETRLNGKLSVGIGGHINRLDNDPNRDMSILDQGQICELTEEVAVPFPHNRCIAGLIYDGSDEVGSVHLGVVYVVRVLDPEGIIPLEETLADYGFRSLGTLHAEENMEKWTRIVLDNLYR
jgi:predicted NUDIX family phosphoesterase